VEVQSGLLTQLPFFFDFFHVFLLLFLGDEEFSSSHHQQNSKVNFFLGSVQGFVCAFTLFFLFIRKSVCFIIYDNFFRDQSQIRELDGRVEVSSAMMPTLKGAVAHVNQPLIASKAPRAIPSSTIWWRN
jgi:hypothetical protein